MVNTQKRCGGYLKEWSDIQTYCEKQLPLKFKNLKTMSAVILQNIFSYFEVLHTAGTEAVSEWDEEALQHALKWAEYCEKV